MEKDHYSRVILNESDLFKLLYENNIDLNKIFVDESLSKEFNSAAKSNYEDYRLNIAEKLSIDISEFDKINQTIWFMPEEYQKMDIEGYLVHNCPKENYQRLISELQLFRKYNMIDLLKFLKYLVDVMKQHNILWGIGRGSSVSSYVLFLLGVHKVDPIKYKLDFKEFLR